MQAHEQTPRERFCLLLDWIYPRKDGNIISPLDDLLQRGKIEW